MPSRSVSSRAQAGSDIPNVQLKNSVRKAVPLDLCTVNALLDLTNCATAKLCVSWSISPSAFKLQKDTSLFSSFTMTPNIRHLLKVKKNHWTPYLPSSQSAGKYKIFNELSRSKRCVPVAVSFHIAAHDIKTNWPSSVLHGHWAHRAELNSRLPYAYVDYHTSMPRSKFLYVLTFSLCRSPPMPGPSSMFSGSSQSAEKWVEDHYYNFVAGLDVKSKKNLTKRWQKIMSSVGKFQLRAAAVCSLTVSNINKCTSIWNFMCKFYLTPFYTQMS